jgi:hypothetical protein
MTFKKRSIPNACEYGMKNSYSLKLYLCYKGQVSIRVDREKAAGTGRRRRRGTEDGSDGDSEEAVEEAGVIAPNPLLSEVDDHTSGRKKVKATRVPNSSTDKKVSTVWACRKLNVHNS